VFDFNSLSESTKSIANIVSGPQPSHLDRFLYPHQAFENQVNKTPHKTAFKYLNESGIVERLTFAQMNDEANRYSNFLRSLNLEKEEALPIMLKQDHLFYVLILACLKVGAVFTPLDLKLPQERKLFMLEQLEARFLICESTSLGDLQLPDQIQVVDISAVNCTEKLADEVSREVDRTQHSLVFRLYTSGLYLYKARSGICD